jgi:hypothetical protein
MGDTMTKRSFLLNILLVLLILFLTIGAGIYLSIIDTSTNRIIYTTFKDLIPLLLAMIASWLTYCIQKRNSFIQHLRMLWSKTIVAVQNATQYTHRKERKHEMYSTVLSELSIVIDEIRGVYKNIDERKNGGYYPFEPIKEMYTLITEIGYDNDYDDVNAKRVRTQIFMLWKSMRKEFLKELDREKPTFSHSHWVDQEKLTITNGKKPQ